MNREEVIAKWNSMQPQERDIWIATDVMGYKADRVRPGMVINSKGYSTAPAMYSADISAAWEVLEKPKIMDRIQIGLYPTSFGKWIARPYMAGYENCRVQADSGPEAICLAALIAQGEGITE
ncbi:hypothetical protein JOD82_005436 [Paenibacillus sp. 1182]|uniref:BC1872 family protein n=1 Tax=Paenibacillus sp. 1182 TaxID=2806565 RepID=UPI001AE7AD70|nr:hypothetical protein [Paenibacillus sp. 1182]MBP1312291.1 hypothetical protein [Paenibacillus sp. 1182]